MEANPALCKSVSERFSDDISNGTLSVLNVAVSEDDGEVDFFVYENSTVHSSLLGREQPGVQKIRVTAHRLSKLFQTHRTPDFLKIDVEHYDHVILRELRKAGCVPSHLSVEAHNFEAIRELLKCDFGRFRLVRGSTAGHRFANHAVKAPDGMKPYSFPHHSSGPFGEDLPDPWISAESMMATWLVRGSLYGNEWIDIHAMK